MKIQIGYLPLICQFSVIDGFEWLIYCLSGGVVCNIAIYADDTNLYYVIRLLIYGNNYSWLLTLNLTYDTL